MPTEDAATRLASERAETAARVAAIDTELAAMAEASAGSNGDDEHDAEGTTLAFEREQLVAIGNQLRFQLSEIDAAIGRVSEGTYGTCLSCGEPIAAERLAALPAARHCVRCAARANH